MGGNSGNTTGGHRLTLWESTSTCVGGEGGEEGTGNSKNRGLGTLHHQAHVRQETHKVNLDFCNIRKCEKIACSPLNRAVQAVP